VPAEPRYLALPLKIYRHIPALEDSHNGDKLPVSSSRRDVWRVAKRSFLSRLELSVADLQGRAATPLSALSQIGCDFRRHCAAGRGNSYDLRQLSISLRAPKARSSQPTPDYSFGLIGGATCLKSSVLELHAASKVGVAVAGWSDLSVLQFQYVGLAWQRPLM
jgi:hypothetical protein